MSIRVIAGSAKGRRLKRVPGDSTRPIMDRVKEACFSILGRSVIDARVLDLFAGTGSVGIEALSRGAARAVFVEMDRMAIQTIIENLKITRLDDKAQVRRMDVFSFLKHPATEQFDLIYIAPPQYKNLWKTAIELLDANPGWLHPEGRVIVQIDPSEKLPLLLKNLMVSDERVYGKTLVAFYTFCRSEETVED